LSPDPVGVVTQRAIGYAGIAFGMQRAYLGKEGLNPLVGLRLSCFGQSIVSVPLFTSRTGFSTRQS
jgi:hypothetical protein